MYLKMLRQLINKGKGGRASGRSPLEEGLGITVRFAHPDDAEGLRRLAILDSGEVPAGPLLVAEVAGELWAAVSITDQRRPIADPFRYTADLVTLLQERADRLARPPRRPPASQRVGRTVYE